MKVFPPGPVEGKENQSFGLPLNDGAAPPPCKVSAAPTPATGHIPFHHRSVAVMDRIEACFVGRRRFMR